MRTIRQQRGRLAEDLAAEWLGGLGWRIVERNLQVGLHDEIDVVAIDPGPPAELVCVEVRSARSAAFGAPEERMDARKVRSLYRAMRALDIGVALPRRVDLLIVDLRGGQSSVRHLPRLEPT